MDTKKAKDLCIRKMCSSPGKTPLTPPPPGKMRISNSNGSTSAVVGLSSDKATAYSEENATPVKAEVPRVEVATATVAATSTETEAGSRRSSASDLENDDFTTIYFKATALEAAANSGCLIDWQRVKTFMICDTKSPVSKYNDATAKVKEDESEFVEVPSQEESTENAELQREFLKAVIPDYNSLCNSGDEDYDVLFVPEEIPDSDIPLFNLPIDDDNAPPLVDEANPMAALAKILERSNYNPFDENYLQLPLFFKSIVSLSQLSLRKDNVIEMEIKKSCIMKYSKSKKDRPLSPFMDISNIHVKHHGGEFFTFCSCKKCLDYREVVVHAMVEQFKAAHMVIMLLDVLIRAYSPMLKNETAYSKFEKLLDSNKEVHWITCGFIYNKKMEHMDFIYDESLSENMILVLFSSILMVNNPVMLLQVLAFHIECIVKAYAEGFLEIVEPDNNRIPAEEMLNYILDGYDDLCRISDQISTYFFAFENYFLNRFSLTWSLLCQRLYQQHVFMNLTDTMLACIITLKEEELTSRHAKLIRRYIQFDDRMSYVERCWNKAWIELNKLNLSEVERKRRKSQLTVYRIFDTVVQDAIAFSLQEGDDDHDFYDFECLENRRLAWQNIMVYTKMKWPNGFFELPNTLVCDDKCKKCNVLLEYHAENCKCITCSIAGGPLPPKRNADHTCYKCLAHSLVDKDINLYESKILNVCASDDFQSFVRNNKRHKNTTLEQLGKEVSASMPTNESTNTIDNGSDDGDGIYHISWALFKHLNNRKRYRHSTIEERYFCQECSLPACMLACKILDHEVNSELAMQLVQYYQPIVMTTEELRSVLPNIMIYNNRMRATNTPCSTSDINDFIVKVYWTFVISVYATYFLELDEKIPPNLIPFELVKNDIQPVPDLKSLFQIEMIVKNDTLFIQFLHFIKSLSPFSSKMESNFGFSLDVHTEEFQAKLDKFLEAYKKQPIPLIKEKEQVLINTVRGITETTNAEVLSKKTTKEKTKKCCFEHSDMGDHCKENHSSKKRLKKECNHARMNETRDRLRKKLSLLVNARKNMKTAEQQQQQQQQQQIKQQQLQQIEKEDIMQKPSVTAVKQPPSLKSVATAAAAVANLTTKAKSALGNIGDDKDDSLECLSSLCKRFSHLQASKVNGTATSKSINKKQNVATKETLVTTATTATHDIKKPSQIIQNAINCTNNNNTLTSIHNSKASTDDNGSNPTTTNPSIMCNQLKKPVKTTNDANGLDVVSEIYELIDIYSKDQSKVKKWINETLSFIEGSNAIINGKKQPQTTNPKKAAKKAKQKQRKEEEKRIAELQDLRWQFHDIYFKEFTDKHKLKALKLSKKRDKKKISEVEVNIKKLQRAKAKVETGILELIATVKQTNAEFKFPYLPTKEQQLKKLQELESNLMGTETAAVTTQTKAPLLNENTSMAALNGLNAANIGNLVNNYGLPFGHGNQFPYHLDFQAHAANVRNGQIGIGEYGGVIRPPMAAPMCYAPQPQKLSPEVVAAMAANAAACNSNVDPSKRIVTIRRVNLPNVPEPQVTVTAKGSSPDKDKLLYTFVNGQLVQTDINHTTPSPPTTTSLLTPLPPAAMNAQLPPTHASTLPIQSTESVFRLPLPPQSKTQKKKERRLLAKLAVEKTKTTPNATQQQSQHQEQLQTGINDRTADQTNRLSIKKKKQQSHVLVDEQDANKVIVTSKQKQKQPQNNINEEMNNLRAAGSKKRTQGDRSASATTSCSAETSTSVTPFSSKVTTRENSVCSLKPTAIGKTAQKQQTLKSHSQQQDHKKNAKQQTAPVKLTMTTTATVKVMQQSKPEPTDEVAVKVEKKKRRSLRSKYVDQGQFDNNPFKSLHMQDSDSDWYSSSDDDGVNNGINEVPTRGPDVAIETVQRIKPIVKQDIPIIKPIVQRNEPVKSNIQPKIASRELSAITREIGVKSQRVRDAQQKKSKMKSEISNIAINNAGGNSNTGVVGACKSAGKNNLQPVVEITSNSQLTQHQQQQTRSKPHELTNRKQNSVSGRRNIAHSREEATPQVEKSDKRNVNLPLPNNGGTRGNCNINRQQKTISASASTTQSSTVDGNSSNKPISKRAQRQAQRRQKSQHKASNIEDCGAGIPNHMGYFNANDVIIPTPSSHSSSYHIKQAQAMPQYDLTQQMQSLHISNTPSGTNFGSVYGATAAHKVQPSISANVSIMDQLNRGVQVENLALPPGITLTKVDPVKSEQLRQKSESIKKLSKPLQPQQPAAIPPSFHPHAGATIIAPSPVAAMPGFYGLQYAGVAANAGVDQSGIIMVEAGATPSGKQQSKQIAAAAAAAAAAASAAGGANGKTSKTKKRRNKTKSENSTRTAANVIKSNVDPNGPSEMITLRNPMFHSGPAAAAATILQQPGLLPGRVLGGLPMPTPLPMDQPAAIIKNENGMFTIRNPALHQAVTNGLAMGGYRQFGNVNYYTPQEAAAEAARATQLNADKVKAAASNAAISTPVSSSFSYFSSSTSDTSQTSTSTLAGVSASGIVDATASNSANNINTNNDNGNGNNTHNTISISCTSVDNIKSGLSGDAAVIARPTPVAPKCISAIGSEIKNAQQQKQKSKECHTQNQWTNFGQEHLVNTMSLNAAENLACTPGFLGSNSSSMSVGGLPNVNLQEKYQQSSYYNGFDVFPNAKGGSSQGSSLFDGSNDHMHRHHNCGDDSPPPTITGYNSYLEGIIPNTGVIRYDDATFLKNLIPGQNLNNEVSIHNVNDSNFARNTNVSPVAHRVEITPVYTSRPTSTNLYEQQQPQQQTEPQQSFVGYSENLSDYGNDVALFAQNNLLNMSDAPSEVESYQPFNYDFETVSDKVIDLNDLLLKKSPHNHSQRTSPYLDESTLENFVQNMSALQIGTAPSDEQCSIGLNGSSSNSSAAGNVNNSNGCCGSNSSGGGGGQSNSSNGGWW